MTQRMSLYQLLLVEYPTLLQVGEGSEGSCFRGSTQQTTLITRKHQLNIAAILRRRFALLQFHYALRS